MKAVALTIKMKAMALTIKRKEVALTIKTEAVTMVKTVATSNDLSLLQEANQA
jgi:hypothetical protein